MGFFDRQTENLKRWVDVSRKAAQTPERLRDRQLQQEVQVENNPCRCLRCGNHVCPFMALPAPYLCEDCTAELTARDQADAPGCVWWDALVEKYRDRRPGG